MKRCPQCEFIYEDDQSLCDMDGVLLVFDSRTLPNHHALATVPAPPRTQRRNRAVPAFATLILALVLGMVYYVSTQRRPYAPPPSATSTANPAPVLNPAPPETPAVVVASSAEENTVKEEPKPAATKAPVKKATTTKTAAAAQSKPATTTPKKDESKVGSILKKTGRILKKPFKF